jgi:hypothetical protein
MSAFVEPNAISTHRVVNLCSKFFIFYAHDSAAPLHILTPEQKQSDHDSEEAAKDRQHGVLREV